MTAYDDRLCIRTGFPGTIDMHQTLYKRTNVVRLLAAAAGLALAGVMAGCNATPRESTTAGASPADATCCQLRDAPTTFNLADGNATTTATVVDDQQLAGTLEKEATDLIEGKKTIKAADLIEQLKRDKCKLSLPSPSSKAADGLYVRCRPSIFVVSGIFKCNKCTRWHAAPASGFALTEGGVIVTNYHVINDASRETLVAMNDAGKVFAVKEVLAASQADDLAILQLDLPQGERLTPVPLGHDAAVGSNVTVISHPDRHFYCLTRGTISRYQRVRHPQKGETTTVSITADFARGSSGAPLLSDQGEVIGIVASTQSVYYKNDNGKQENLQMVFKQCVPVSALRRLIEVVK